MDAGSDADPPSAAGCDDDLVRDGAFCIGWRWAAPSQRCLEGQPELVVTDVVPPWTDRALLAVECSEEAPQLYSPGEDRWRRAPEVATWPTEALDLEGTPPDLLAAGALPDATVVALAGSLHAHGPFAAWIAEPGGEGWRRSIDVPWVNPIGAAALSDDSLLFAGDESLILVLRPAR